jgi:uncharacterized membrane protein YbhN (UPF0104 family)
VNPRLKSALQYVVITLIGVFFLYFVFKGTDWVDLLGKFRQTNYAWIAAGMLVSMLSHVIRGYRATIMYDALGYRVSVKHSVYAVLIGYMMNYFIPRAGEVSRCAALQKTDGLPVDKSLGTVVTERIFDVVIMFLILGIAFILQFDMLSDFVWKGLAEKGAQSEGPGLKTVAACVLAGFGLLFLALRKKLTGHPLYLKFLGLLKGFAEGLLSVRNVKQPVVFVFTSVLIWVCYLLMMYFCLFSMEATAHLGFADCVTVFAVGALSMVIPAPGAGAGTYHFAIMQSLLIFGVSEADGIAYATIVHGVQMVILLVVGAVCSLLVLRSSKQKTVVA